MSYFIYTFFNVIFPLFLIIFSGYALRSFLPIDVKSLVKLQLYLLIPSVLFVKVYESDLTGEILTSVTLTTTIVITTMYVISLIISKLRGFSSEDTSVFINTSTFFNAGNFSLPLMQLLYTNPMAVSIQAIIMLLQNVAFFTIGMFTIGKSDGNSKKAMGYIFKMPFLYIIITAIIFKKINITIWDPIWQSLSILSTTYGGVALITLGAQLRESKFSFGNMRIYLSNILRLIISPLVGFTIVMILGIEGITAQVLVIAMGAPTAVNVALTSIEFDNKPEFASQAVLTSTALSAVTMTLVIIFVQTVIPL